MDWIKRTIVAAIVLAFFTTAAYGAHAEAISPGDGPTYSYKVIEDRQNALGEHPVLLENPKSHNPSYDELMAFLKTDDTVKHKYSKPDFTCADFAMELQNHAEEQGLNCGYASLKFYGKDSGHAVDVFQTTDEGMVYVDDTSGKPIITYDLGPGYSYYNLGVISQVTNYW